MGEDLTLSLMLDAVRNKYIALTNEGVSREDAILRISKLDFEKILTDVTDTMSTDCIESFEQNMYENVLCSRLRVEKFLAHNEEIWYKGFIVSEAMYLIVLEMADNLRELVISSQTDLLEGKGVRYMVLTELHGRACQQYLEILHLLKGGFADGAFARWRSLYELSIICEFISENPETVAQAYLDSADSDDGKNTWAKTAECFKDSKRVTFDNIKKQCSYENEYWKESYRLANKIVHASPLGTFSRMGAIRTTEKLIPAGRSDYGLAIPAMNAAVSLFLVTAIYFSLTGIGDALLYVQTLGKWIDKIQTVYEDIQKECFDLGGEALEID
ncbi:MAG: hypothetical protein IKK50_07045 [Ruminiclostridium sp.]|nr:hypothetical protein [Ruminiclostridium sp.]